MMISSCRRAVQHLAFILFTYGGRFGLHFGNALPCFSCPYVTGCGGHCYLMALQSNWWGLQMPLATMMSGLGLQALLLFALFALLVALLGKSWCGWLCPFGLLQDWLTMLRQRLGVPEAQISQAMRDRLRSIKYLLLVYMLALPPLIASAGLHSDFSLPFCQICPAKPLMPLFTFETAHLAINSANAITQTFSILSVAIAALMLVGMFFKERFFCLFCPMLAIIHIFQKIIPLRLKKNPALCLACGNCARACPMTIRRVHEDRADVQDEDCLLCLNCLESCPSDTTLRLDLFGKTLVSSKRRRLIVLWQKTRSARP
ncbi:MAG: 4Fe-4S binding protein [Desulfobulbaceae bacterium]|jgi:polyferredoxin|nr:4Fe-4S binding protein [Desulfobulbaceae bacterium]